MLKAGQILYDNDPRYRGRKLEVVRVEGSHAVCMCGPRQVKVRLEYIFSDGQQRRSGYSTDVDNDSLTSSTRRAQTRENAAQLGGSPAPSPYDL
jgi:hypothetical protein